MVGIGGMGMCGIAEVLLNLGYEVSGSDLSASETTRRLKKFGARIFSGHYSKNVDGVDVVVYSSAVHPDNVEVAAARERQIPVIRRAEMLAELMRMKYSIAVAGAHGKTTTTSLIAAILAAAGLDPTVVVGGRINAIGANARLGEGEYLVAEADESDGTFLRLVPTIAVVTNIDEEHLDFYRDFRAIKQAFMEFVNKVPFYGFSVVCLDHPAVQEIIPGIEKRFFTYGFGSQADYIGEEFRYEAGEAAFATARASGPVIGWRTPWPMALTRRAQSANLGMPVVRSSTAPGRAPPRNQMFMKAAMSARPAVSPLSQPVPLWASWSSSQAAWPRHWPLNGPAAAFIALVSNGRPESCSRSLMKASGTLSPSTPKMIGTVVAKNSRSAHRLIAQSRPPRTARGSGQRRSISARIAWLSQYTSAPICSEGVRR